MYQIGGPLKDVVDPQIAKANLTKKKNKKKQKEKDEL